MTQPEFTTIAAHEDTVVWSRYRPDVRRYVLEAHHAGVTRRLPVPAQRQPFDVDLGPDRAGRMTAVYSRCRAEGRGQFFGAGCSLRRYRFGDRERPAGVPHRRGVSEHNPSIWRDRLVFARYEDYGQLNEFIEDSLWEWSDQRLRRLPDGRGERHEPPPGDPDVRIDKIDVRGATVAFSWADGTLLCPDETDITDDTPATSYWFSVHVLRGARRRTVDEQCTPPGPSAGEPSLSRRGLHYMFFTEDETVLRSQSVFGSRPRQQRLPRRPSRVVITDELRVELRYDGTFRVVVQDL